MSVTLKQDSWNVKDPLTGEYRESAIFSTTLPQDAAAVVENAQGSVETIAQAVMSMTQMGTDTTLSIQGAAADAKTVGDKINGYVTPEMFGYSGGDASSYVRQCVDSGIRTIKFTNGLYRLKNIDLLSGEYEIIISQGSILMPADDASYLFNIGTTGSLKLSGGLIDINYISNYAITAYVHNNQYLIIDNVEFSRIKKTGIYVNEFGGNFKVTNCYIHDMQYETNDKESATFIRIMTGQYGYKGNFIFSENRLIETSYKNNDYVSAPGGLFISDVINVQDQQWGNRSNALITNNVFDGLGSGTEPIYSVHVYYQWDGIVIDSNIFKNYFENAISVKDSSNVVISNNIFEDGQLGYVSGRDNYAGAINYQPSGHIPGTENQGLSIIGNIFKNAPRKDVNTYSNFITLWGLSSNPSGEEYGNDVVISNNRFENALRCIFVTRINNFLFNNNVCRTNSTCAMYSCKGNIIFSGNDIETYNGAVFSINDGKCENVKLNVTDNNCIDKSDDSVTHRLFYIRSVYSCLFSGNYIYCNYASSVPCAFSRYDENSQNIKRLSVSGNILDGENRLFTYNWSYIDSVEGDIFSAGSPVNVVTPAGPGRCRYYDISGLKYYVSRNSNSWLQMTTTVASS